jgi:antitoxin (DNA-binding transcriptional repressor) of toxin-antitoxin stability system
MHTVSLFETKTHLSRIVESLANGSEKEIIISRHGKPMVRMVAMQPGDVSRRIGSAKGQFRVPDDIDAANHDIANLFSSKE